MSGAPGAGDRIPVIALVPDAERASVLAAQLERAAEIAASSIGKVKVPITSGMLGEAASLLRRLAAAPATDLAQIRRASARGLIIRELVMFESETGLMPGKVADRILDGLAVLASGRAGEDGR